MASSVCSGACRAGSFCAEGALAPLPCSRGTYSTRTDLSSADQCTDAQPGYYATTGSTQQTPCSRGTIQPEPKMGSCDRCSAGTFQEAEGQQTCQTCPAGFYCPEGASAALPCEGGTFSSQTGAQSIEDCTECHNTMGRASDGGGCCSDSPNLCIVKRKLLVRTESQCLGSFGTVNH